jgi:glucosylceramidase
VGFGGAFTEAAAINWRSLSPEDQDAVIRLYFGSPADGGHGYSLGRVPMNSCDFSPASYNFDNVTGDNELAHFDTGVKHDVEVMQHYPAHFTRHGHLAHGHQPHLAQLHPNWPTTNLI